MVFHLFSATICGAKEYYVSSSLGNDSNDGLSVGRPWRTLQRVQNAHLMPGDSALLRCGDTWRETLTLTRPGMPERTIRVGPYGAGSKPRICGSKVVEKWKEVDPGRFEAPWRGRPNGLILDGIPLRVSVSPADRRYPTWLSTGKKLLLRLSERYTGDRRVEVTHLGACLTLRRVHDVVIDGIRVEGANVYGIRMRDCSSIEVKNCEIANNAHYGIALERDDAAKKCSDVTIINNDLTLNANGIYLFGKAGGYESDGYVDCKITNNRITHTNFKGIWGHNTKDGHGIGIQNSSECVIEQNYLRYNYSGVALWTADKFRSDGNKILSNVIADSWLYGLAQGGDGANNSADNLWAGNVVVNNGLSPGQWGGLRINRQQFGGDEFANNTLCGNDINIYLYSYPDYHLVVGNSSEFPRKYHVYYSEAAGPHNVIDGNRYYGSAIDETFFIFREGKGLTFLEWKSLSKQDRSSTLLPSRSDAHTTEEVNDYCAQLIEKSVGVPP